MTIWRKLKRLLRRKRGLLSLALILLCFAFFSGLESSAQQEGEEPPASERLYIGLSEQGVLTLFQGPPEQNQVIETFFRIDTDRLKTGLDMSELEKLKAGIEISSQEEYEAVLATYRPFAAGK